MDKIEVANNLETPEIGQGQETGEEATILEQPEVQAQEGEEGKGIPDDPKLLRQKMTLATQEASEVKKQFDEYKSRMDRVMAHPKFKQLIDEVESGQAEQGEKPVILKYADMSDEQKTAYKTLKPFIATMLDEMGILPELAQIKNYTLTSAQRETLKETQSMLDNFYTRHPEAKEETVNKAVADIINNGLTNGERISLDSAWKIYTSDSAETKAKQKVMEENKIKKEATLPKPSGATPAPIIKGKMSPRRAVEMALEGQQY